MTFEELYAIIQERAKSSTEGSYTASLMKEGIDRVAQKVGEEAIEVVIASKNDDKALLVGEMADLVYHLLVLMNLKDVSLTDIQQLLAERHMKLSSTNVREIK